MGRWISEKIGYAFKCLLDVIYPQPVKCTLCGRILDAKEKHFLCSGCLSGLKTADGFKFNSNYITKEEFRAYCDGIFSVCRYEGTARDMVHLLKYNDKRELAISMGSMIGEMVKKEEIQVDIITSVPLHSKRGKKRGYNQACLIGKELSDIAGVPYKETLNRVINTKSQVLFNEHMRWYNIKDAFKCIGDVKEKNIILIDDVMTTGATIYFASRELKNSGAKSVFGVSFARTII